MQFLKDSIFVDNASSCMAVLSSILLFTFFVLSGILLYKRIKNKKIFKNIDNNLEYFISEIGNIFFSSLTIFCLMIIKFVYFLKLDNVLFSLWFLFGLILTNLFLKGFYIISKVREKYVSIKNTALRIIDNYVMIITITICASIIASQIPMVDISKFFNSKLSRFELINLPFFLISLFIFISSFIIIFEHIFRKYNPKKLRIINDSMKFLFPLITIGFVTWLYPLTYNLFMVLFIGILAKYLTEKLSTYLNNRRLLSKKASVMLGFLTPISNIFFSSFIDMAIMAVAIFASLNYAGYYGLIISSLGLISSIVFASSLNIFEHNSEVYKYIAKTINNIALFYIFFETLEFIHKEQINVNIFSSNVIIGLFLSITLILFNILKVINLVKYSNMKNSKLYLVFRSVIYVIIFASCVYLLLPYINHEILGALVLGLILITALTSIFMLNTLDAFEKIQNKNVVVLPLIRNTILPLINQVSTILIIIVILLLPIIKYR